MHGHQFASATYAGRLPDEYRLLHRAQLTRMSREVAELRPGREPRLPIPGLTTREKAWQAIFYVPQL